MTSADDPSLAGAQRPASSRDVFGRRDEVLSSATIAVGLGRARSQRRQPVPSLKSEDCLDQICQGATLCLPTLR